MKLEHLAEDARRNGHRSDPFTRKIPRHRQREELGTDWYHGGAVFHDHASLDPGFYHAGLVERLDAAGVVLAPQCPALAIDERPDGVTVKTPLGPIEARDVMLATNGYSGALSPWHQNRIVPIGSYIIATEALDPALVRRIRDRQSKKDNRKPPIQKNRKKRQKICSRRICYLE